MPRAARYHHPFSVLAIDLDGLKAVNDTRGHAAGDDQLRAMADAFRSQLRASDRSYRTGGDEFVSLLPETPRDSIPAIIDRLVGAGAPAFSWGRRPTQTKPTTPQR